MIPLSKDEITSFSPASFENLVPRPTFRFRPATPRDRRNYTNALHEEGLRNWSDEAVQAEIIRAMRELWAGDDDLLRANEGRLRNFWETVKQAAKDPSIVMDANEGDAVGELTMKLIDHWPPLRRMNADNLRFSEDAPKIALSMYLAGWEGIETGFRLIAGRVPIEVLDELEREIGKIEAKAVADKVEGITGIGFVELTLHALGRMSLTKDAEKNSPSPSPSSDDQNGSKTDGTTAKGKRGKSANTASKPGTTPETM